MTFIVKMGTGSSRLLSSAAILLGFFVLLITLIVTLPWRLVVLFLAKLFHRRRFRGFVNGFDQTYCNFIGDNWAPHTLLTIVTIQGYLDIENVRRKYSGIVTHNRDKRGRLVHPRLRQTFKWFLGYRIWVEEEDFNLEEHVYEWQHGKEKFDKADLQELVPQIVDKPWPKNKSPYEAIILNNFEGRKDQSLFFMRSQHGIGDGLIWSTFLQDYDGRPWSDHVSPSYMKLFKSPDALGVQPKKTRGLNNGSIVSGIKSLNKLTRSAFKVISDTGAYAARKRGIARRNLDVARLWECDKSYDLPLVHYAHTTAAFPIQTIKQIRKKYGVGFNSVLFSVVGGSLRRVMEELTGGVPTVVPVCTAAPKFEHPKTVTNHFLCGSCELPLKPTSPGERLLITQQLFEGLKDWYAPVGLDYGFTICGLLPGLLRDVICQHFVSPGILCSTFPMLGKNLTFDNHLASDLCIYHGSSRNDLGLSILIGGCEDQIRFTFTLDVSVDVPPGTAQKLGDYVEQEIEQLLNF